MNNTERFPAPENNDHSMPPLPKNGESGLQVCKTVRLYLAILDDLQPEQVELILEHVHYCADCAAEQRLVQRSRQLVASLPGSVPSTHVDQKVITTIEARMSWGGRRYKGTASTSMMGKRNRSIVGEPIVGTKVLAKVLALGRGRGRMRRVAVAIVVLAAVLLLALGASLRFIGVGGIPTGPRAFALPTNLTWNGYVLYHSETKIDAHGLRYRVYCYHYLGTDQMRIETLEAGSLDVVVVSNSAAMLGLDMMHHVAQWGAKEWGVDDWSFDPVELRSDLAANRAVYLDKDMFHEQPVYRIRYTNGFVLLLNMHYQPVNVLRGALGPGTGEPIYDTVELMPFSQVPSSTWDMSVPSGFHIGTLPPVL